MIALLLWACVPVPTPPVDPATPTPTPTPEDTDAPFVLDTGPYDPAGDVDWVDVPAGVFEIGSPDPAPFPNETPLRTVSLRAFAMMRHEARIGDHNACVDAGVCAPAPTTGTCLPVDASPELPRNCLAWEPAAELCTWLGGRLPSEAEWEYVASGFGAPVTFPWGETSPDCEHSNVVFPGGTACPGGLWEVCTHPEGDTPTGFCDMGGNAFEWVADWFRDDYLLLPVDGSPESVMLFDFRSMRGGGIGSEVPPRVRQRTFHPPDFFYGGMGVRCAMDR